MSLFQKIFGNFFTSIKVGTMNKTSPRVFFLEEQTNHHLIFGCDNYDLLRTLYVHPGLYDAISAILWGYYAFLSGRFITPLEDYHEWHNTYQSIHEVTQMITKPLENLEKTRPDTANLVLEKRATIVKILKERNAPIYISISLNATFLTHTPEK